MNQRASVAEPAARPDVPDIPRSVAIIMDGNGRWAEHARAAGRRGPPRRHAALRRTVEAAIDLGVESLAVYAFSTENWTRPTEEVDALMEIFAETIERELPDLVAQGVRVRFIGRRDRAPDGLQARMAALEGETEGNDRLEPLDRVRLRRPRRARRGRAPARRGGVAGGRRRGRVRRRTSTRPSCPTPTW